MSSLTDTLSKLSLSDDNKKSSLGQYYTTNPAYILQGVLIPSGCTIIEPFAGGCHLLSFKEANDYNFELYDIDPRNSRVIQRDTILNPPSYAGKFVITNPPYLARNKSDEKKYFDKYNVNDLYKCFIKQLLKAGDYPNGGVLIIPLNFWCSIRKADIELRRQFLDKYDIIFMNIFEEDVFVDTSYTVCCFQFENKTNITKLSTDGNIKINIFPQSRGIEPFNVKLTASNNYMIGGELYLLPVNNNYKITRLTHKNKNEKNTNILVKCIDDYTHINFKYVEDEKEIYIDTTANCSARSYLTLIITPCIDENRQREIVSRANEFLSINRKKYNSLFLTNYRESREAARKRISFDLVYDITKYLLSN